MPNVTNCPACGNTVSTQATGCPRCGHPLQQQINKSLEKKDSQERFLVLLLVFFLSFIFLIILFAITQDYSSSSAFYGIFFIVSPLLLTFALLALLLQRSTNLKLSFFKEQLKKRKLLTFYFFTTLSTLTFAGISGSKQYREQKDKCYEFIFLQNNKYKTLEDEKIHLNVLLEKSKDVVPICQKINQLKQVQQIEAWQINIRNKIIAINKKAQETQLRIQKQQILIQKKKAVDDFPKKIKIIKFNLKTAIKYRRNKLYREAENTLMNIERFLTFLKGTPIEASKEWIALSNKLNMEKPYLRPYLDRLRAEEERLENKKREEEERLKNKKREEEERRGEKPLVHFWDGSVPVVERTLKQMLKDPDSYKHISTTEPRAYGSCWLVQTKYRAKNSFGGYVVETKTFCVNKNGAFIL